MARYRLLDLYRYLLLRLFESDHRLLKLPRVVQLYFAREVLVSSMDGAFVPLGQVATVRLTQGPATIRTERSAV